MTEKRRASQSNVTQSTASDFKPLKAKRETEHGDARQNKTEAGIYKAKHSNAGPDTATQGQARQRAVRQGKATKSEAGP